MKRLKDTKETRETGDLWRYAWRHGETETKETKETVETSGDT